MKNLSRVWAPGCKVIRWFIQAFLPRFPISSGEGVHAREAPSTWEMGFLLSGRLGGGVCGGWQSAPLASAQS